MAAALNLHPGLAELGGIGLALIAKGIELAGVNKGTGQTRQIIRQQRRQARISTHRRLGDNKAQDPATGFRDPGNNRSASSSLAKPPVSLEHVQESGRSAIERPAGHPGIPRHTADHDVARPPPARSRPQCPAGPGSMPQILGLRDDTKMWRRTTSSRPMRKSDVPGPAGNPPRRHGSRFHWPACGRRPVMAFEIAGNPAAAVEKHRCPGNTRSGFRRAANRCAQHNRPLAHRKTELSRMLPVHRRAPGGSSQIGQIVRRGGAHAHIFHSVRGFAPRQRAFPESGAHGGPAAWLTPSFRRLNGVGRSTRQTPQWRRGCRNSPASSRSAESDIEFRLDGRACKLTMSREVRPASRRLSRRAGNLGHVPPLDQAAQSPIPVAIAVMQLGRLGHRKLAPIISGAENSLAGRP